MTITNVDYLKKSIQEKFELSTFNDCSFDSENQISIVINETYQIYNFDQIKDILVSEFIDPKCRPPKSLDSLIFENEKMIFFEFKNTSLSTNVLNDIKMKIYESVFLMIKKYSLLPQDFNGTKIYLIYKGDERAPSTHKFTDGLCPNNLLFMQEALDIKILKYEASSFQRYLERHGVFPDKI